MIEIEERIPEGRKRTQLVMNIANSIDYADAQLVPAVYRNLEQEFNVGPQELGIIPTIRALIQAFASPVWGWIADRYSRKKILSFGCLFWGIVTILIGTTSSYFQILVYSAVNGIALGIITPTTQSLITDFFRENERGKAFGWLGFTSIFGAVLGTLYATSISSIDIMGIEGWRFSFYTIGLVSIFLSVIVFIYAKDPVRGGLDIGGVGTRDKDTISSVREILTTKSFIVLVGQGVVGLLPWNALVFLTLWFQYIGMEDFLAALGFGVIAVGAAFGSIFGGWIGDRAAKSYPNRGRIIIAQISLIMGVPLIFIVFKLIPRSPSFIAGFMIVGFITGFFISWPGPGTVYPILGEVVRPENRSTAYALLRLFEGSVAASGPFIVGYLAENYFGYVERSGDIGVLPSAVRESNVNALADAMLLTAAVPWLISLLIFTFLYKVYPNDRRKILDLKK